MSTTFPISLPTTGTRNITIRQKSSVGVGTSPYTLERQVQRYPGEIWELDVEYAPLARADAEDLIGALCSLNGREGTFLFGDSANKTPRGIATGTPLVNGAGQTGYHLATDGWAVDRLGILEAGDWIGIGSGFTSRLYKVLLKVATSRTGAATLTLWPRVKTAWADNAAISTSYPKGVFALTTDGADWSVDVAHRYGLKFSAHSIP